jgi:predicted anti-sigma-YlaC factor YlaD
VQFRSNACDRAREYVSRRLDGDLSELEAVLLRAHLKRCLACRDFDAALVGHTTLLRNSQLEPLGFQIRLPSLRRNVWTMRLGAIAAVTAVALIGTVTAIDSLTRHASTQPHSTAATRAGASVDREFWSARRDQLAGLRLAPVMQRQVASLQE